MHDHDRAHEDALKIAACIVAASNVVSYDMATPEDINEQARKLYRLVTARHWQQGWSWRDGIDDLFDGENT